MSPVIAVVVGDEVVHDDGEVGMRGLAEEDGCPIDCTTTLERERKKEREGERREGEREERVSVMK